ncbi:MAG: electron transfer flavoprotein subunit beta/FixA family protein [Thermoprotei archaeon]
MGEKSTGLNIVVAVKQVPDVSELRLDPVTHALIREGVPSVLNPYDRQAMEAAVFLKNSAGGKITVVTMGPPQSKKALQECIALGADEAVLLTDRAFAAADTWATAYTLASYIKSLNFDFVITGLKAIDGETGQVGPELAEFLGIPHVSYVRKIELEPSSKTFKVERQLENGYDVWQLKWPALLTVAKEFSQPRFPTLHRYIVAKKAAIRVLGSADLLKLGADQKNFGLKGSPTFIPKVHPPPARPPGTVWEGDVEDSVKKLARVLLEKELI